MTSLAESLERIMAQVRAAPSRTPGRPVRCVRCRDTGVVMFTAGLFDVGRQDRSVEVEASEVRPVCKPCSCRPAKVPVESGGERYR